MSKALLAYVALAAVTLVVFGLWPGLDLAVSHIFFSDGSFDGDGPIDQGARGFFRVAPFVVLALYGALWLARRYGLKVFWAPTGRAMIFLIATMIIGPGLIVNLGFKDHWHRPRPVQTQDFNGPESVHALVRRRRGLQKELFVRLRRSGDRILDGRAGKPAASPLARSRNGGGGRLRLRRKPAAARLRRTLPLRRAARRAHHPHRHRGLRRLIWPRNGEPLAGLRTVRSIYKPG